MHGQQANLSPYYWDFFYYLHFYDKKLKAVGIEDEEDEETGGIIADLDDVVTMDCETRIQGFAGCFLLGLICSVLGSIMLWSHKLTGFSILVSLGSILSLLSTCFLLGPFKQLKKMFDPVRLIATLIYIVMIVLTIVAGLLWKNPPMALIFVIGQYTAMAWYSLSYIPFARDTVSKCICACIS